MQKNELKSKDENRIRLPEMQKSTSWIFRIAGIIFFVANMITVVEMLQVNISTFMFIMDENSENSGWNVFFILTTLLYTTSFLCAIMATGTAAIFGGKNNYTQSVYNSQIVAVISLALYAGLQIITRDNSNPEESETLFILATTLIMEIFFAVISFFCLKELPNFKWKNILPKDPNSKLCLKVYLVMLALVETGCFIYANKVLNQ